MLDRHFIRNNIEWVRESLSSRGFSLDTEHFARLDSQERNLRRESEDLRQQRNAVSQEISQIRQKKGNASRLISEMREVGERIKQLGGELEAAHLALRDTLARIPNIPHESVPVGKDEQANQVVRSFGEPPEFCFNPLDHVELGSRLGILDPGRAAKVTGARFTNYYGDGARLERALISFMLDVHTSAHGYIEVLPPFMANRSSFFGTGNLPKFEDDLFKVEGTDYLLVPTAEVPVTNLCAGETLQTEHLPLCFAAYTPCFRSEAGSHGKDTRGLIRQHQFNKVELVRFANPEDSFEQLEILTRHAEEILKLLGLAFRTVVLSSGDMGFSSAKTYDLEVWIPTQNTYREISSCSNFLDFQARRANIRCRSSEKKKSRFLHTLNGSGLAVGRTWVAIIENFQQEDGSVIIPEPLRPYLGDLERIEPKEIPSLGID